MADTAAIAAQDMRKLAQTSNPLEVVQNPIVVSVSLGVLGAYLLRKSLYTTRRDLFGKAACEGGGSYGSRSCGRVVYYKTVAPDSDKVELGPDGKPVQHPNAYTNRILLNLGGVILGSLLINNKLTEDPMVDYIGLGVAAGSFANLVMTILNID